MAAGGDSTPAGLTVVHATPSPWGSGTEVDILVRHACRELAARGHRVAVIAPSASREEMEEGARKVDVASADPGSLFSEPGEVAVLAIGGPPPLVGNRGRLTPVPGEAARLIEELLSVIAADIVHVHDPFAPSVPSTALRHSFSLNVGSFHLPHERLLSTQLARPLVEVFLGRLDARTVTHAATSDLLQRYFPGTYEPVGPGADAGTAPAPDGSGGAEPVRQGTGGAEAQPEGPVRILYRAGEERGAMRLVLRALRRLPGWVDWRATVVLPETFGPPPRIGAKLRERIELVTAGDADPGTPLNERTATSGFDLLCLASSGASPTPSAIHEALAGGLVPVVSDIPVYSDLVGEGDLGPLFPPGDADTLAGQLARLADPLALRQARERAGRSPLAARRWSDVAAELEAIYRATVSRRHSGNGDPTVRRRLGGRELIEVDLHMHTDHSPDCATPVRVLLETAADRGLGAIAVTDHNEISGALAARDAAADMNGLEVIVGEEVKTAEQGEVIGLFLEDRIPRGMTMAETIAEIRRQGGLVYMPHPFDRLHSVPDYDNLVEVVDEIDFIEVFNPRVAIDGFNEEAARFAGKYGITPAAGSDSHVAQGLGSVRVRIPRFEGPEEFREAMRDAEITRRHKNLVYVQALKLLQTAGRPKAPKRELASASPARGGRPRRRV